MNRTLLRLGLAAAMGLALSACSGDDEEELKEHVWKDQTETIDRAREVEGMVKDAAGRKSKAAEDSSY